MPCCREPLSAPTSTQASAAASSGSTDACAKGREASAPPPLFAEVPSKVGDKGVAFAGGDLGAHLGHGIHGLGPAGGVLRVVAQGFEAVAGSTALQHQLPYRGIGLCRNGGGRAGIGHRVGAHAGAGGDKKRRQSQRESEQQERSLHWLHFTAVSERLADAY